MKYRKRLVEDTLRELCRHFPVVAVLGARQVGKSTLVNHLFSAEYDTVVFDPVQDVEQARAEPDLFLSNHPGRLFLDEAQYAPELLSAIKRKVDRSRSPGQFILSGSQNLSVIKNISESLAGRVAIVELRGLSFQERQDRPGGFLWHWVNEAQGAEDAGACAPMGDLRSPPPFLACNDFQGGLARHPGSAGFPAAPLF